jgi:hypothetical protein
LGNLEFNHVKLPYPGINFFALSIPSALKYRSLSIPKTDVGGLLGGQVEVSQG